MRLNLSRMIRRRLSVIAAAAALVAAIGDHAVAAPTFKGLLAQEPKPEGDASKTQPPRDVPADDLGRSVPRTAVEGFLQATKKGDYEQAVEYLDLRGVKKDPDWTPAALARALKTVLDRVLWIDLDALSDAPEGYTSDGLPASRDRVGKIDVPDKGKVDVLLQRVSRTDGAPVWKFAAPTVTMVPELWDHFGYGPLADRLPHFFFDLEFLGVQLWQWIGLIGAVLVALLVAHLLDVAVLRLMRWRSPATADAMRTPVAGPLRLLLLVLLLSPVPAALRLGLTTQAVLGAVGKSLVIVALTWSGVRLMDVLAQTVTARLYRSGQATAVPLVAPTRKAAKGLVIILAAIATLGAFGVNVTALVAGLGVGGIAVALAAQKTVENVIGGVTLFAVQPVRVGDFCRFGDQYGTVEEIGLYATRVRTLERTVVTIPNATFSTLQLDNFTRRDRIWYHPTIGLRYETTPDQLRYVLVEIRKLLYAHPRVHPDPARVRFVGFGAYSLDIEIFAYVLATDMSEFLEVAEDLNLRIMDVVTRAGSGFAFPSQTAYLEQGEGLDVKRARAAEAEVAGWRERGELHVPRFPPETIKALDDTLDYPPRGSSAAASA